MGSKPYEQPLQFNGEPAYNDPRHIKDALCQYEEGPDIQDLTENDDGVTYVNARGDVFEKKGDIFYLKSKAKSPEFLAMEKMIKEKNPGYSDDLVEICAREEFAKRSRIRIAAEKAAAAEAAKKAEKAAKKEANRQNKKPAKK
jgi:hypothetical protein